MGLLFILRLYINASALAPVCITVTPHETVLAGQSTAPVTTKFAPGHLTLRCIPVTPSDIMTAPVALMRIGGDPDRAPAVMKHNGDALLSDRDRLIRWQKWYKAKPLN